MYNIITLPKASECIGEDEGSYFEKNTFAIAIFEVGFIVGLRLIKVLKKIFPLVLSSILYLLKI